MNNKSANEYQTRILLTQFAKSYDSYEKLHFISMS